MGRHSHLQNAMTDYYGSCCHDLEMSDNSAEEDFGQLYSSKDLEGFVRNVYENAYKDGSFDRKRVNAYAELFAQGVANGYGGDSSGFDFDTPDYKMLEALKNNVFHFSAAKNRAEIVSLSAALRDANGKLRSFQDFKLEASKIVDEYQGSWLRTEYDTAVNSATLAARWMEFEDDDIIVFTTVGDERVRAEHKKLDGIAKRKTDKFWDTCYPPLAWNCRCTVVPSLRTSETSDEAIPADALAGVPSMFRSNFAKEGVVFPPNHPYNKFVGQKLEKQLERRAEGLGKEILRGFENNGKVVSSAMVDKAAVDFNAVNDCCEYFAAKGNVAEILPKVHKDDILYREFFEGLIGSKYEGKCPDFKIGDNFYELEGFISTNHKKALRNMFNRGFAQARNVVIENPDLTDAYIKKVIGNLIREGVEVGEVWIKTGRILRQLH